MNYIIFKADLNADKAMIISFWNANERRALEHKFNWLYKSNPEGQAEVWLIKHTTSDAIVGMTSLFPRKFFIDQKPFNMAIAGDLLISKNHRIAGPALMLQRSLTSYIDQFKIDCIFAIPNSNAEPIFKRVGYRRLGSLFGMVKPFHTFNYLQKIGSPNSLARLIHPIFDFFLKLLSRETYFITKKLFPCQIIDQFDNRFDSLWHQFKFRTRFIGDRSPSYLNWKFLNSKTDRKILYSVLNRDKSESLGYIASRIIDNSIEILDFSFPPDKKASNNLLAEFLNFCRFLKVSSVAISFLENKRYIKYLRKWGFFNSITPNRNIYCYTTNNFFNNNLKHISIIDWHFTMCDEDI
jgi:hypothetical protein